MSSKRKPVDTSLFRPREETEQEQTHSNDRDMSPTPESTAERREKRASFDLYEDQIYAMQELKVRLARQGKKVRMSDLAREAVDLLLDKYQ